jgi:hypothetical protein
MRTVLVYNYHILHPSRLENPHHSIGSGIILAFQEPSVPPICPVCLSVTTYVYLDPLFVLIVVSLTHGLSYCVPNACLPQASCTMTNLPYQLTLPSCLVNHSACDEGGIHATFHFY